MDTREDGATAMDIDEPHNPPPGIADSSNAGIQRAAEDDDVAPETSVMHDKAQEAEAQGEVNPFEEFLKGFNDAIKSPPGNVTDDAITDLMRNSLSQMRGPSDVMQFHRVLLSSDVKARVESSSELFNTRNDVLTALGLSA